MNVKSISWIQKANCNFQVAPVHAHTPDQIKHKQTSNYLPPKINYSFEWEKFVRKINNAAPNGIDDCFTRFTIYGDFA